MVYRVFWKKEWQLTSLFFLENSVDRGYSSWGLKESDPTEGPTLGLIMYRKLSICMAFYFPFENNASFIFQFVYTFYYLTNC